MSQFVKNYNMIPKNLIYSDKIYPSNRGDYVCIENFHSFIFDREFLTEFFENPDSEYYLKNADRFKELVKQEFKLFEMVAEAKTIHELKKVRQDLYKHPFWAGEESYLLEAYMDLHNNFQKKMQLSRYPASRNTVGAVAGTCVSYLQRHNKTLYCVSRSCDISLGFYADLYTFYLYLQKYDLNHLEWFITVPHIYVNNLILTEKQFKNNEKINKGMIFNMRKSVFEVNSEK